MPVIRTLRPSSTITASGWVPWPSGTLWGVTSDDDDATWADGDTNLVGAMVLGLPADAPTVDHWRHRVSVRSRVARFLPTGQSGPVLVMYQVRQVRSTGQSTSPWQSTSVASQTPQTITLQIPMPADTAFTTAATWELSVEAQMPAGMQALTEVYELWVDVDWRARPSFTPIIRDGTGAPTVGPISDTLTPTFSFDSPAWDGLPPRWWRVAVYTAAEVGAPGFAPFTTPAQWSASGAGTPPSSIGVGALTNATTYTAYWQVASTITPNLDLEFPSDIESVAFSVAVTVPNPPSSVTVTATPGQPVADVCWTGPAGGGPATFVGGVVVEIQRSDCGGPWTTIHTESAAAPGSGCWEDTAIPVPTAGHGGCDSGSPGECDHQWRVRWWGLVDIDGIDMLLVTDWATSAPVEVEGVGSGWLSDGETVLAVCVAEGWSRSRSSARYDRVSGGLPTVITARPGGRDWQLEIVTNTYAEALAVEAMFGSHLVWFQPDLPGVVGSWVTPVREAVSVPRIGGVMVTTVSTIAVEAEPAAAPESFF